LKTFSDGPQSLRVNVADRAGNSTFLHHQWRRDTVKPQVRFLAKPLDQIGETQASFRFAAEDDASGVSSLECRTHSETSFHSCQSPANLMQLGEGQHIFFVRAKDKAGNYSEELSHAWNVDLTAPALTLVSRPQKYERSTRADFRWKVEDQFAGVDNVLCEWNQQPAHPCSEQDSLQGVSEGLHTWSVRAVDKVGNKSQPLRVQWVNDMTPPNLNWIRTPAEMDQSQQALIQFVADDSISGMDQTSCWLDEKLYPCTSQAPVELNGLGVGWHSFRVSARDRSGNTEEMVHRWLVYPAARGVEETWNISSYGAVDLLFVVDSSKSMDAERTEMGRRFGDLMGQLSGLDWQIAMTTTDVQSMDGRSRGQLMDFLGIGLPILTAQIPADQAWAAFRDTIENAKEGDPYERGIFATYMALERYQQDLAAQQFFRKNSHLEVIVITDADNSGNEFMDQPQNLFDYVKNLFGPEKNFSFHSLIVEPGDRACVKQGESYGEKYFRLSQMTSGVVGSVCAKDYGQVVLEVGLKIRERHRERNLQCAPYDANRDGIPDFSIHSTPEARPPLRYQFEGSKVRFDQFLPLGTHQVKYNCIKNIP
jgi:hypothetical protein